MAVVVQCFHCNTILELDEGFRGGVCRCSTCGSLLQVPKAVEGTVAPKARPAAPGKEAGGGPVAGAQSGDAGLSRGQFDAAGSGGSGTRPAIPDFGGSSSGLRSGGRPAAPTATAHAPRVEKSAPAGGTVRSAPHMKRVKKSNALLVTSFVLLGVVAVAAVVVAVVLLAQGEKAMDHGTAGQTGGGKTPMVRSDTARPQGNQAVGSTPEEAVSPAPARVAATGFLNVPLAGRKIVLSIDGASSMSDDFDYVRNGVYQAMGRLGAGQELRVAVWRDQNVLMIPAKGFVGKGDLALLKKEFDVLPVRGSTDAEACMKASLGVGGDQVIFVTAKPALDPTLASTVMEGRSGSVRLDSVKLDAEDTPSPLEELAKKTGGTFYFISGTRLQELVGAGN